MYICKTTEINFSAAMGLFLKRNPTIEKVKFVIKLSQCSLCDLKTKIYPFDMHIVTAQVEGQRNPQEF